MTQARLLGGRYQVGELLGYGGMAEVHRWNREANDEALRLSQMLDPPACRSAWGRT